MMDAATGLDGRIVNMRTHIAQTFGLIVPEIRLTDSTLLHDGEYVIRIQGVEVARSMVDVNKVMVLLGDSEAEAPDGVTVAEPVYGAPARWIDPADQEKAALMGLSVVSPTEVVATHLLEVIKQNFSRLFSRRALRKLLDEFVAVTDKARADANRRILDEFVPDKVSVDTLHGVLRLLLEERVSIRNLPLIMEAISESQGHLKGTETICEHVRHRLGFQLVAEVQEADGSLPLIHLGPDWEEQFKKYQLEENQGLVDVALPPEEFNRLSQSVASKLAEASEAGRYPAIVTSTRRRRFLRTVLSSKGIRNPVFSFEEIGSNIKPTLLGTA
jgi:flagellar biosynthesis protein FlhA